MAKNLLILALLIVLFFFMFSDPRQVEDKVVTKIDTLRIPHDTTIYKKGKDIPYEVLDSIYLVDTLPIHDTAYIVKDYNEVKSYSDILRIDTDNFVYIKDTISQNRILGRGYDAHLVQKTITITHDIYHKPKNELYVGLIGDLRRFDNKIGVGVGINYKKQNESYIINYTTNQISVGLYKKLL
jgi:hypothetical protein